jgi:hypothetical protein
VAHSAANLVATHGASHTAAQCTQHTALAVGAILLEVLVRTMGRLAIAWLPLRRVLLVLLVVLLLVVLLLLLLLLGPGASIVRCGLSLAVTLLGISLRMAGVVVVVGHGGW